MTLVHEPSAIQAMARPADAEYQLNFPKCSGYRLFRVWKIDDEKVCVYAEEGVCFGQGNCVVTGRASFRAKVTKRRAFKVDKNSYGMPAPESLGGADDGFTTQRSLVERFLQFLARDQMYLVDDRDSPWATAFGDESVLYLSQSGEHWFDELGLYGPLSRLHVTRHW